MTTHIKQIDGINFKLVVTPVLKDLEEHLSTYELDSNIHYIDMDCDDDKPMPIEKAKEFQQNFLMDCLDYKDSFKAVEVIQTLPKKKNGTFYKNRVLEVTSSRAGYVSESDYGIRHDVLRWKVIDDVTAELQIVSVAEPW